MAVLLCHAGVATARPPSDPALARVASPLREALAQGTAPSLGPTLPALRLGNGEALVELRFSTLTPDVVARAVALGARVEHVSLRYARLVAGVPLAALADLAALPGLSVIHPLYGAQTSVGAVQSQVRGVLELDALQSRFGVDGSGVRVGLLSDSITNTHGGQLGGEGCARTLIDAAPQLSGDLPASMIVLDPGPGAGRDEGTGMGEVVHDLAPGAALLFASALPDEATFAENIAALRACGADVIADDVLFFAEPMFQDGIIAQAVDAAAADGALFFSAAANTSDAGIDQVYRDSDPRDERSDPPTGVDFHDFGAGRPYTAITVPPHCDLRAVLQWNEPFSGTLGAGAHTDLDLYVYNSVPPGGRILTSSTNTQGCAAGGGALGDPLEIAYFRNVGTSARTVYLAVNHVCGDKSVRLRLVLSAAVCVLGFDPYVLERGPFGAAAIYGHPAASGAVAMAAIDQQEVASDGGFTPPSGVLDVEGFSARGGALPFYFDGSGVPLPGAPVLRLKPDLAAPDGGDTAYFGIDVDHNGFPNFYGTSAAAPAAAAVAALLTQAAPHRAAGVIADALRRSARDIGITGRDPAAGDGLIDPLAAIDLVQAATAGDCNGDGLVTIDEIIIGVRIALGDAPAATCAAVDTDGDGAVSIAELITAVGEALG
ncbi:MAG TPA: S8 family serine peptidase [Candidatus Dormibacteraeota bacterium]|nr:S8 family serine peptidase [Candidatus Dormibacteraeota bacterium]